MQEIYQAETPRNAIFVKFNIANLHPASTPLNHRQAKLVKLPQLQTHIMATEKPVAIVCVGMAGISKSSA